MPSTLVSILLASIRLLKSQKHGIKFRRSSFSFDVLEILIKIVTETERLKLWLSLSHRGRKGNVCDNEKAFFCWESFKIGSVDADFTSKAYLKK